MSPTQLRMPRVIAFVLIGCSIRTLVYQFLDAEPISTPGGVAAPWFAAIEVPYHKKKLKFRYRIIERLLQ